MSSHRIGIFGGIRKANCLSIYIIYIYVSINQSIYLSMALDRFAADILAKISLFALFYSKKCPPKSVVQNLPNMTLLFSLNLLLFPRRGFKNVASTRKRSRQQTGLEAIWRLYIYICETNLGKRAEYCFESTVWKRELTGFCSKLDKFCKKLGECALAHTC